MDSLRIETQAEADELNRMCVCDWYHPGCDVHFGSLPYAALVNYRKRQQDPDDYLWTQPSAEFVFNEAPEESAREVLDAAVTNFADTISDFENGHAPLGAVLRAQVALYEAIFDFASEA